MTRNEIQEILYLSILTVNHSISSKGVRATIGKYHTSNCHRQESSVDFRASEIKITMRF